MNRADAAEYFFNEVDRNYGSRPATDREHLLRAEVLAEFEQLGKKYKLAFAWAPYPWGDGPRTGRPCNDWECHVAIGRHYYTCISGYAFDPGEEPGDNTRWVEADVVARVLASVALGGHSIAFNEEERPAARPPKQSQAETPADNDGGRQAALMLAGQWTAMTKASFQWQYSQHAKESESGQSYRLWRCHVVIGECWAAVLDKVDLGPDDGAEHKRRKDQAENEAALLAMKRVGLSQAARRSQPDK